MTPEPHAEMVGLVDDDQAVLQSLDALLGARGYRTRMYASASDLFAGLKIEGTDCVVMDIRMPGLDGMSAQRRLASERPDLPVVLITGDGDVATAVAALKAGAADFLEKPFEPDALVRAVEEACARKPAVAAASPEAQEAVARLTPREMDVLRHMVAGDTNKEIARSLGNSPRTVEIHRAHIMNKLGARSLAQVIRIAMSAGIV